MSNKTDNSTPSITENNFESSDFLLGAVSNSELLLNYATEHGLDIGENTITTIIKAKRSQENNNWDTETEIKFWIAYKNISALVKPVSVNSLLVRKRENIRKPNFVQKIFFRRQKLSYSRRTVRVYMVWAMIVVLAMLTTQIFSLKGSTLLSKIQNNNGRISEIDYRVGELRLILKSDSENESAALERRRLESEKMLLDQEIKSSIDLLIPWVQFLRKFVFFGSIRLPDHYNEKEKATGFSTLQTGPGHGDPGQALNIAEDSMNDRILIVQEAQNFTLILQLYMLPLLYGLIGGFVFVLRTLARDINTLVFSQFSKIKYSLRIILGTLAGLIVGLLWGDIESQQITFLESLSTAAIAFIAGYGVEYLFNGLDRFAESIGKGKPEIKIS